MPLFIRLASLTDKGSEDVRDFTKLVDETRKALEAHGGRMVKAFVTLGRYDLVALIEAPDARTAARASALIAGQGKFKAETLMAIPVEEFTKDVGL